MSTNKLVIIYMLFLTVCAPLNINYSTIEHVFIIPQVHIAQNDFASDISEQLTSIVNILGNLTIAALKIFPIIIVLAFLVSPLKFVMSLAKRE